MNLFYDIIHSHMAGVVCFLCHKGSMAGKQHKHHPGVAGGRWKKRAPKTPKLFKPNLHAAHMLVDGVNRKVRLCTKCLRLVKGKSTFNRKEAAEALTQSQPVVL
jgi:ribosomal protein L28